MTFPQHIAITMVTTVLRVATRVCARDVEGWSADERRGERHKKGCEQKKSATMCKKCNGRKGEKGRDVKEGQDARAMRRDGAKAKKRRARQRNTDRRIHRAAAAWPLYRSIREMSMSNPVPSLLGSTAAAS